MEQYFIYLSVILSIIIFIPLYRVVRGPTIFDRMLGASAIGSKTLVLICIIGIVYGRIDMFIDITLAYAVLNFIAVIAISRYLKTVEAQE
jgi:multicomponent Na+:H+ antiporter subunit F